MLGASGAANVPGADTSISYHCLAKASSSSVPCAATCPATRIATRSQIISSSLSMWLLMKTVFARERRLIPDRRRQDCALGARGADHGHDDLHQRALARPVGPQQAEHLAPPHAHIDPL